jgi:hypothetical protein
MVAMKYELVEDHLRRGGLLGTAAVVALEETVPPAPILRTLRERDASGFAVRNDDGYSGRVSAERFRGGKSAARTHDGYSRRVSNAVSEEKKILHVRSTVGPFSD